MKMKRGSVTQKESQLVTVWVPVSVGEAMEKAIESEDSDRSKFIRRAVREKLQRMGILAETETKQQ